LNDIYMPIYWKKGSFETRYSKKRRETISF